MTSEQRLDRLERIAKLFVRAGIRYRRNLRELDEKFGILLDAQIRNEDVAIELRRQMEALAVAQAKNEERFAKADERFAKADERFATLERQTDQTLQALLLLMRERRNGKAEA